MFSKVLFSVNKFEAEVHHWAARQSPMVAKLSKWVDNGCRREMLVQREKRTTHKKHKKRTTHKKHKKKDAARNV